MSLQKKTLLVFFGTMATIAISLFIFTQIFLLNSLDKLDQEVMAEKTRILNNAIQATTSSLINSAGNYAVQGEVSQSLIKPDSGSEEKNFENINLRNTQASFLILLDTQGNVVYENAINPATGQPVELSPSKIDLAKNIAAKNLASISGYSLIDENPQIFASQAIMQSDTSNSAVGFLVLGREIDNSLIETWEDQ